MPELVCHTSIFNVEIGMADNARRVLWLARIQQWRDSGLSQRAFAKQHGFHSRQVSYWVARFAECDHAAQLIPVSVKPVAPESQAPVLTLHSPSGWTVKIARSVPAAWLGALLQSLR